MADLNDDGAMGAEEGRMAGRIVRLRQQLQDEFFARTCAACHHHLLPADDSPCPACGVTVRLDRYAFRELRHENSAAHLELLGDLSREVTAALARMLEEEKNAG
jgi:hypothetical protein